MMLNYVLLISPFSSVLVYIDQLSFAIFAVMPKVTLLIRALLLIQVGAIRVGFDQLVVVAKAAIH